MPVYFVRAGETGPVKIGFTRSIVIRIQSLQISHYKELHLLRQMEGDKRVERSLHEHYQHLHIRSEWFEFDPSMLAIEAWHIAKSKSSKTYRPRIRHHAQHKTAFGKWVVASGRNQRQFAADLGISPSFLTELCQGKRTPSASLAVRIVDASEGFVTFRELIVP